MSSARTALLEPARAIAMGLLSPLDRSLRGRLPTMKSPAIFIIGPPRSGTSLFFELMVSRFRLAYISNLAHRLYRAPVAASWLGRSVIHSWQGKFESQYGYIPGWGAPCEGGWVWGRWIPESHFLDESHLSELPAEEIRTTISGISASLDAPFVSKNVMHSAHMRLLDVLFPGCVFIKLQRDPVANIRSIVKGRELRTHSANERDEWRSIKPREWEQFRDADYITKACAQVYYVHRNIDEDAELLGPERVLTVRYEDITTRTDAVLSEVGGFLASHAIQAGEHAQETPLELHSRGSRQLEPDVEERIAREMERFWGAAG